MIILQTEKSIKLIIRPSTTIFLVRLEENL
jgi:hypothetical protein